MSKSISKDALAKMQKTFGKGSVMKLSDGAVSGVEFTSTGSLLLDHTIGGFPKGRIIEIFGPESSGKTTCTIMAIVEAQKAGKVCGFIDAEHSFDPVYAESLGVDVDELLISQPDNGEQALEIALAMIKTGEIGLVVVDSTSALTPKSELEGEIGDSNMGKQARLMSQALRMLNGEVSKNNATLVFISQLRDKIGPYGGRAIGVGNALKFYSSIRLQISKSQPIMKDGEAIGHTMKFKAIKNKVFPPYRECEVMLRYGHGYDKLSEILVLAVELGIAERKGAWYAYSGANIGQGLEKSAEILKDNPDLAEELTALVIKGLKQQ